MPVDPDDRPKKPSPNFPLFPHMNGSWIAKIDGKGKSFGGWANDRRGEAARIRYDDFMRARREGTIAKPVQIKPDAVTVRDVCNLFLAARQDDGISARTYSDYKDDLTAFATMVGPSKLADALAPDDFAAVRAEWDSRLGPHALGRKIQNIRAAFKWAGPDGRGLIGRLPLYGGQFNKPKAIEKRRAKRIGEKTSGKLMFEPDEIRKILAAAPPQLKAMTLLGLNCGFLAIDCARLTKSAIDFDRGVVDFVREKTENPRTAVLWRETIDALRAVVSVPPKDAADADLVFLTRTGVPWVRDVVERKAGNITRVAHLDAVSGEFGKLLRSIDLKAKGKRVGLNFAALRKTFRTAADDAGDRNAALLVMGHSFLGMDEFYVRAVKEKRLKSLAVHVRLALLRRYSLPVLV